jgi:FKBP-type peptidyl-prolyl cis-trans isomerase FklB
MLISASLTAQKKPDSGKVRLESKIDSISYSFGVMVAENMLLQGVKDMHYDAFEKGFYHVLNDKKLKIEPEDASLMIQEYFNELKQVEAEENLAGGKEFLEKNKEEEGVITLPSGLQYKIMEAGEGKSPKLNDEVLVHYQGSLLDGRIFDSSYERGQPITFTPGGVIQGWKEALTLMRPGSKWKLWVPPDLAYGERGAGDMIGPNATLVFEVELLEVLRK